MEKLLGVVFALCMACIPMCVHAQDSNCFAYGERLPFDESYSYYDLDENVWLLELPKNVGSYMAYNSDTEDYVEFKIIPKEVEVRVCHNMDEDFIENPYVYECDGNYNFKTNVDTLGNFVSYGTDCLNYSFVYSPSTVKDLGVRKTIVSHEDMELIYDESGYTIYSDYEDVEPIHVLDVGQQEVCFSGDSSTYIFKPFRVCILPRVMEINPIFVKEYGQQDPNFETKDYILSKESGEDVGDYKLTVKSKNKNYKYVLGKQSVFRIVEKETLEIKEVSKELPKNKEKKDSNNLKQDRIEKKIDVTTPSKVMTGVRSSLFLSFLGVVISGIVFILLRFV